MRIVDCLTNAHNLALVALAALICVLGSWITVSLLKRVRSTRSGTRAAWAFLGAVAGGATVWCTHFVAMIAYEPGIQVTYEPGLTGLSLFVAICGCGAAFLTASLRFNGSALVGGALFGLTVAACTSSAWRPSPPTPSSSGRAPMSPWRWRGRSCSAPRPSRPRSCPQPREAADWRFC